MGPWDRIHHDRGSLWCGHKKKKKRKSSLVLLSSKQRGRCSLRSAKACVGPRFASPGVSSPARNELSHCAFSLSLSLSVGGFPSCAFNLLCSYPAFMKCAVRSRRAKSRAGCRCRFLGRSLCAFGATPPQPSIDSNPLPEGPRCSCCSRTATCLPTDLGHLSHVPLDAGGLIRY